MATTGQQLVNYLLYTVLSQNSPLLIYKHNQLKTPQWSLFPCSGQLLKIWGTPGEELASRLTSDRELVLLNFAKTNLNSFVKWDLVIFFHLDACTVDTAENIARSLRRNRDVIELELEELVEEGILEKNLLADKPVYRLTTKTEIRTLLDLFLHACENMSFRIKMVDQIIQEATPTQIMVVW